MPRKKKVKEFDFSLAASIATIVTWLISLCGVGYAFYALYLALFWAPEYSIGTMQLIIAIACCVVPLSLHNLVKDFA